MECELMKGKGITGGGEICLNYCPYPHCIYDIGQRGTKPKWLAQVERDNSIVKMSAKGKSTKQIAERFSLGERHIRRILEQHRKLKQLCEEKLT